MRILQDLGPRVTRNPRRVCEYTSSKVIATRNPNTAQDLQLVAVSRETEKAHGNLNGQLGFGRI